MNRKKVKRVYGKRKVVRFQFEIDPDLWKEMEQIQEAAKLTTMRELLINALYFMRWAARHKEEGRSITATGLDNTVHELVMPALENIQLSCGAAKAEAKKQ